MTIIINLNKKDTVKMFTYDVTVKDKSTGWKTVYTMDVSDLVDNVTEHFQSMFDMSYDDDVTVIMIERKF